ncbi:MAG: ComF family protein [Gammaproteobacteria bacterium]|nr:ComF family protein [Gammaproteobacteria bacterium]
MLCGATTAVVVGAAGVRLDICQGCYDELPWNHHHCCRCALPLKVTDTTVAAPLPLCGQCQRQPPRFDTLFAPFTYDAALAKLITGLKFSARLSHGRLLGELLAASLQQAWQQQTLAKPQAILAVPLHWRRQQQRGYNQAGEVARYVAARCQIPLASHLCRRQRATAKQTELHARERQRNMRGAFVINPNQPLPQHIAMIDDVVTTGATVRELTIVLKRAGVQRVDVWALARVGND